MMMAGDACGSMMLGENASPSCLKTKNKDLASQALLVAFFFACFSSRIQVGDSRWNYGIACTRVNRVMFI